MRPGDHRGVVVTGVFERTLGEFERLLKPAGEKFERSLKG